MIRYLIKNNLKLMLRNKWVIALMILSPIVSTAILSNVFDTMMQAYEEADNFIVGYRLEEDSKWESYIDAMKEASKDAGITFLQCEEDDIPSAVEKNDCASFVDFTEDAYTIYKQNDCKVQGMITEYFFFRMFHAPGTLDLKTETIDSMPNIEANDYYGMIYNVYYIWCCFVSLSVVFSSEKKNRIGKRFQVSPVSEIRLVLAKAIPCILATMVEMLISFTLTTLLFNVHWGNIVYALAILSLVVVGATFFGLFMTSLLKNLAISAIAIFSVTWIWGFIGGTFETYMFSSVAETVKRTSPLYYVNRSLVEVSLVGESTFTKPCILIMLALIVICFTGSCAATKLGKGVRA